MEESIFPVTSACCTYPENRYFSYHLEQNMGNIIDASHKLLKIP